MSIKLEVQKNIVRIPKDQDLTNFIEEFLVKYEETLVKDFAASYGSRSTKYKSVKERRELYREDENYIYFSRGLLEFIPNESYEIISSLEDNLIVPDLSMEELKKTLDVFDLRDDQCIAVNKCLKLKRGVTQLPTAVGKSAIITSTIKRLLEANPDMHSLVLAPTISTVKNMYDTLDENGLPCSTFKKNSKLKPITCAHIQSLLTYSAKDPEFLDCIDAVFYDECLAADCTVLLSDYKEVSIFDIYNDESIQEVLSYNLETNEYEPKKILKKYKTPFNDKFYRVYYIDPITGEKKGISATSNHKIYTNYGYVQVKDLTNEHKILLDIPSVRGVKFLSSKCWVKVHNIRANVGGEAEYKYNLEIEDNHNYFANRILVSNCHHLKCDTWNKLNSLIPNAEYSLGFSALSIDKNEISKTDIRDLSYNASLIVSNTGRVLLHVDPSYYIEKGIIAKPIVFRINHNVELPSFFDESNWVKLSKVGLLSEARSEKVSFVANAFSINKRKILILVSEKKHAFMIGRYLKSLGNERFGMSFGSGEGYMFSYTGSYNQFDVTYKYYNSLEVIDKLNEDLDILIATSHVDEGVDIKNLDACILAGGGKSDRKLIQRVGRVLRKTKNGKYAYVIDFTDIGSRILSRQSNLRLDLYREELGVANENIYNVNLNELVPIFKKLEQIE